MLCGMDGTLQSIPHDTATAGLKLALVTETWPPEVNGVAMTLSRLVDGLRAQGCDVSLVRPRRRTDASALAHELLVPGLPIPGYAGLRFGLPVVGQLRRQWRRQRPDVVHIATEGPLGWAALHVARSLNIPVASTFHTNFHRYCAHYRVGWLRGLVTRHLRTFHNRSAFTMVPNAALQATLQQEGYRNVAVPFGDQVAFVQCAHVLAGQPDRVREMGQRASSALAAHSWRAVSQQFHDYLHAAVHGSMHAE